MHNGDPSNAHYHHMQQQQQYQPHHHHQPQLPSPTASGALCSEGSELVFEILQAVSDICAYFRPQVSQPGQQQQPQQRPPLSDLVAALEEKLARLRRVHGLVSAASRQLEESDPVSLLPLAEGPEEIEEAEAAEGAASATAAAAASFRREDEDEEVRRLTDRVTSLNGIIRRLASGNAQLIHQLSVMLSELPG